MKTLMKLVVVSALALGLAGTAAAAPQAPCQAKNPEQFQLARARGQALQMAVKSPQFQKMTKEERRAFTMGLSQGFNQGFGQAKKGPQAVKPVQKPCPKAQARPAQCPKAQQQKPVQQKKLQAQQKAAQQKKQQTQKKAK